MFATTANPAKVIAWGLLGSLSLSVPVLIWGHKEDQTALANASLFVTLPAGFYLGVQMKIDPCGIPRGLWSAIRSTPSAIHWLFTK